MPEHVYARCGQVLHGRQARLQPQKQRGHKQRGHQREQRRPPPILTPVRA